MMYLFGWNLRDAGDFQSQFDRMHPEKISDDEIRKLVNRGQLVSFTRTEETDAQNVLQSRLGCVIPQGEAESLDTSAVEGMIVAVINRAPRRRVIEGERFSHRELSRLSIGFLKYSLLPSFVR